MAPAEDFSKGKAVVTEKIVEQKEDFQTQQRIPITILSEDEGYLLEEDEPIAKAEAETDIC